MTTAPLPPSALAPKATAASKVPIEPGAAGRAAAKLVSATRYSAPVALMSSSTAWATARYTAPSQNHSTHRPASSGTPWRPGDRAGRVGQRADQVAQRG